jgi:small GTP-binding protein
MTFHVIRVAIIGNGGVGKTSFLEKYCNGTFSSDYIPTVIDHYDKLECDNQGHNIKFIFMDMAGQDDFKRLREKYYDNAIDIILVAFAINDRQTLTNVKNKWLSEIRSNNYIRDKPIIFIGTKLDVRKYNEYYNIKDISVKKCEGDKLAELNYSKYIECSSFTGENINKIFDLMLEIINEEDLLSTIQCKTNLNKKSNSGCIIS